MTDDPPCLAPDQPDEIALHDAIGVPPPSERVQRKVLPYLDQWTKDFIRLSPLVILGTSDARFGCDVSPRGGRPGFVTVLGDDRLFIPEYAGNRMLISLRNIRANPRVALLFMIPGVNETARVTGDATVVTDAAEFGHPGAPGDPSAGTLIRVHRAFYHCGRALRRADLWSSHTISAHVANPPINKRPIIVT